MQATMNAPRTGFPSHQSQAPTRALPAAPQQKAAPSPEQLQQAAQKLVHAYANAVVEGLYKIIMAEADKCEKEHIKQNVIVITLGADKTAIKKTIQPMSLQNTFASGQIDNQLAKLNPKDAALFNSLAKEAIGLMTKQCENTLKVVQAYSTNTFNPNTLEQTNVTQSAVFKTQLYIALGRIPEQHKQIIFGK